MGGFLADRAARVARLGEAMMRLAAELDSARLYQAAAYVSMAGDAILRQAREDPAAPERRGEALPDDVDLDFTLDREGRVWMIREGDCHILGRTGPVCAEMSRFLASVALGRDGYS